jgi:hypothetical protein
LEMSFTMLNYYLANDIETDDCYNEFTKKWIENTNSDNETSCSESGSEIISDDDTVMTINSFTDPTLSDKIMGFLKEIGT